MPEFLVGSFVTLWIIPLVLAGLAVAYVGLRIRDTRAEQPDPELGVKAAFHALLNAGVLLALTGASIAAIDIVGEAIEGRQPKNAPVVNVPGGPPRVNPPPRQQPEELFDRVSQRVAWPLIVSGALFALVALLLVKVATNDSRYPAARRAFAGLRLVVGGLNVFVAVTLMIEMLFQKEMPNLRPFAVGIGLLAVWMPTAAVSLFQMKMGARHGYYVPPKPKKTREWDADEEGEPDRGRDRDRDRTRSRERDEDEEDRPRERRRPARRDRDEEGEGDERG